MWTTDGRTTDGRTPDHDHPLSSPCEPNSSGELKKQKDFKNVMSFCGTVVSTVQLYKPLAEKHKCRPIDFKWEQRRILQIKVDAHFVKSAVFISMRAKYVVLTFQGQRMWNVTFLTISLSYTKLNNSMH